MYRLPYRCNLCVRRLAQINEINASSHTEEHKRHWRRVKKMWIADIPKTHRTEFHRPGMCESCGAAFTLTGPLRKTPSSNLCFMCLVNRVAADRGVRR